MSVQTSCCPTTPRTLSSQLAACREIKKSHIPQWISPMKLLKTVLFNNATPMYGDDSNAIDVDLFPRGPVWVAISATARARLVAAC